MPPTIDMTGQRIGRLFVQSQADSACKANGSRAAWVCECDCGNTTVVVGLYLRSGQTKSCGCLRKELLLARNALPRNKPSKRWTDKSGYVLLNIPGHQNASKSGCVREHVFVMSNHIGRPLRKGETVHHKNGVRSDNRIKNLELWLGSQPSGQRVTDLLDWAREIVEAYSQDESRLR